MTSSCPSAAAGLSPTGLDRRHEFGYCACSQTQFRGNISVRRSQIPATTLRRAPSTAHMERYLSTGNLQETK